MVLVASSTSAMIETSISSDHPHCAPSRSSPPPPLQVPVFVPEPTSLSLQVPVPALAPMSPPLQVPMPTLTLSIAYTRGAVTVSTCSG